MAPIRCPVSCASTSATWKRQSTSRDTPRSVWYSSSDNTTRVGFFSVGVLRPLSGFGARRNSPRSSLDLAATVEHGDQKLQVVLDGPVGHRPPAWSDLARPPRPDEPVPVALGKCLGTAAPSEEPEEHPRRRPVGPLRCLRLGGRHLFTVDFKQLLQGERLGLGFRLAVQVRGDEACRELVRLPLRQELTDSHLTVTVELMGFGGVVPAV